jgi:tetratricopeptide (TPR) repeat protein
MVKERVESTFQQATTLLAEGKFDDVIAGCTLILQMDPLFDPAKKLLQKARNPSMTFDFNPPGGDDPRINQAREALLARDFQRALHYAGEILAANPGNDDARAIADVAQEKIESAPFIQQFIRKSEESLAAGNAALARTQLEKARALDADHPDLAPLERAIDGAGSSPAGFSFGGAAPEVTPSFVVDTPAPAPGRGTAQASDFGFTFEEQPAAADGFANFSFDSVPAPAAPAPPPPAEPAAASFSFDTPSSGGGFSFDSAPPPAAAPAAIAPGGEFDFSSALSSASPDDQKKISQYLEEGDAAFDGGEYQKAIDLWSRIFLIDVTNDSASERIERAKVRRREVEQRLESILGPAVGAFDRKDYASARAKFNEILAIDPTNFTARDYLGRMPDDDSDQPSMIDFTPPPSKVEMDLLDDEMDGGGFGAPAIPAPAADRPAAAKKSTPAKPVAPTKKPLPLGLIGGAIALVVLIAGGWFGYQKFAGGSASDPAVTQAIFTRAAALAQQGKYDQAITALQEVPADDPQRDKALVLIADYQAKNGRASQMIDGKPAAQYYEDNLTAARTAFEAHDFVGAKLAFEQAMRVKALPPDAKVSYDAAQQQTAKLDSAKALFAERKYQDAITNLETLLLQDPQNKNIQRMMIDAHFNLGATALREERLPDAMQQFDEVLKLDPADELAKRSRELAQRYDGEQKDLLYKVYVKYLPFRQAA